MSPTDILYGTLLLILIIYFVFKKQIKQFIRGLGLKKLYNDNQLSTVGDEFELKVANALAARKDVYKVYNNLYFSTPDLEITDGEVSKGTIVQQDIIAITKYGIMAIECKNYGGYVIMSTNSQWNHNDVPFQNPAMQNENHIKILKQITGDNNMPIINAVVFSDDLQNLMIIPGEEGLILEKYPYIARLSNLNKLFNTYKNSKDATKLTKSEANKYHKLFIKYMFVSKKIKNAQTLYAMKQNIIHNN